MVVVVFPNHIDELTREVDSRQVGRGYDVILKAKGSLS